MTYDFDEKRMEALGRKLDELFKPVLELEKEQTQLEINRCRNIVSALENLIIQLGDKDEGVQLIANEWAWHFRERGAILRNRTQNNQAEEKK